MYVRLAFAVAAHLEPEILIVDEVLAVGDAEFQKQMPGQDERGRPSGGRTVLFVSHSMSAISQLCQRAILFERGGLKLHGNVGDVVRQYMTSHPSNITRTDLSNHKNRVSSLKGVFRSVEMLDEFGHHTASFHPHDTVVIKLSIHTDSQIVAPRIGIGFFNERGERVVVLPPI